MCPRRSPRAALGIIPRQLPNGTARVVVIGWGRQGAGGILHYIVAMRTRCPTRTAQGPHEPAWECSTAGMTRIQSVVACPDPPALLTRYSLVCSWLHGCTCCCRERDLLQVVECTTLRLADVCFNPPPFPLPPFLTSSWRRVLSSSPFRPKPRAPPTRTTSSKCASKCESKCIRFGWWWVHSNVQITVR